MNIFDEAERNYYDDEYDTLTNTFNIAEDNSNTVLIKRQRLKKFIMYQRRGGTINNYVGSDTNNDILIAEKRYYNSRNNINFNKLNAFSLYGKTISSCRLDNRWHKLWKQHIMNR